MLARRKPGCLLLVKLFLTMYLRSPKYISPLSSCGIVELNLTPRLLIPSDA